MSTLSLFFIPSFLAKSLGIVSCPPPQGSLWYLPVSLILFNYSGLDYKSLECFIWKWCGVFGPVWWFLFIYSLLFPIFICMDLKTFVKCFGVAVLTVVLANLALFALSYSGAASLVSDDCGQLYLSLVVLYNILVFFSAFLACLVFFAVSFREKRVCPPVVEKPQPKQKPSK